jgi:hypothetical protein
VTAQAIEPTTLRFLAQCLNQLHHRIPLLFNNFAFKESLYFIGKQLIV